MVSLVQAGAACSLEFLDSAQPVWRPVDTGQWLDGNVAGGGGGALPPAWWASVFLRGCWAQVLSWEGALHTPPHPGLSQAPLSSTSTSLSLVPALSPFMRKAPISFSILLEVTGSRLRTAHRPSPHTPNLSLPVQFDQSTFIGFQAGSTLELLWCTGPSSGSAQTC